MKTIEEKCDELFVNCSDDMSKYKSKELAVNLAEFTQRWIPVEEELPEIGEKVQVKLLIEIIGHKTTVIDHDRLILKDGKTWMFDVEQMAGIAVTHWRPIELK